MSDLISRQEALEALWKALYEYEDKTEKQFQESEYLDVGDWIEYRNFVQNMNDIDRQTIRNLQSAQPELITVNIDHELTQEEYEKLRKDMANAPIMLLPSAQPEPHWIPVTERLPEKSGRYLVTRGLNACGSLWNRIYIANYSDLMGLKSKRIWWQGNVGKSDFERLDDVLAWMPLPEPYKGEES